MAKNKMIPIFMYTLLGFAAIGLVSQLFGNPTAFFRNILMMLGGAVLIFGLLYFLVMRKRTSAPDMRKYKQAVKQSKSKYKQENVRTRASVKTAPAPIKKRSRKPSHLKVIEGTKQKSKDRASF